VRANQALFASAPSAALWHDLVAAGLLRADAPLPRAGGRQHGSAEDRKGDGS